MAETTTIRATHHARNVFTPEEADLYELCQLAGVTWDPEVFKVVNDLLRLNVHPSTVVRVLKRVCIVHPGRRRARGNSGSSDGSRRGAGENSPSGGSMGSGDQPQRPRMASQRSASASSLTHVPSSLSAHPSSIAINGGRGH